ncbi:hypothetical protein [Dactylosporangium sp. CA-092794]|uniref:hypothetical protein n=1 Tax=Dactylosporangium sp. CA-092794 TaxID=3239929 RepID=UPI003D8B4DB2
MRNDVLEPIRLPAEFWNRADVHAALHERDMGALFRLVSKHGGASQTRISIAVAMPQSSVNAIMSTNPKAPWVKALEVFIRIADGLHMPDHARNRLGLANRVHASTPSVTGTGDADPVGSATFQPNLTVASDTVDRRTLVAWGVAAAGVAALGPRRRTVGRVGRAQIQELQQGAARLYALDYQHGGDTLWLAARAMAADAHLMLEQGSYTDEIERSLLSAIGRLHLCAGWLAFDAGQHDDARICYNEALSVAHQATDPDVEAHAFANLAFQSNILGKPREGLRFANAAARAASAPNAPTRLAAVPQLRIAMALSASNDKNGSNAAIKQARHIIDGDADKPTTEWYSFLSPIELDGVEGTCALNLNDPRRAEPLLMRAIQGHSDAYARNRALYSVRLAQARLDNSTIDGAAEAAASALDDLRGQVASWRVSAELDQIAQRLSSHRGIDGVDEFLHQYALSATRSA